MAMVTCDRCDDGLIEGEICCQCDGRGRYDDGYFQADLGELLLEDLAPADETNIAAHLDKFGKPDA